MTDTPHAGRRANRRQSADDESFGETLVVVSNRQPYRHTDGGDGNEQSVDRPTGGLTAGLDPVLQETGGTWIAWGDGDADREVVDANDRVAVPPEDPAYTLRRVWLSDEQVESYYYGFSNQVLWPICHGALGTVDPDPDFWRAYRRTNEQFAETVAGTVDGRSTVWFHDYHLGLAPAMTRARVGRGPTLLHFWHVPWPSWETFRACPHRTELLRGLLANDVFGVHVPRFRHNFLECVDACLSDASVDRNRAEVTYRGSVTRVEALPMGVPFEDVNQDAAARTEQDFADFREEHDISANVSIGVGVDRLDYTKGIVQRLEALETLWETQPDLREEFTFVQNASESRSTIPAYARVQSDVEATVDRINERFGTDDWRPVVYFTDRLGADRLYGLYRHADVCVVSSIKDGLNLVALEYVASQVDADGALVLSDQTGAHDVLGSAAYTISPFEIGSFAATIEEALTAPADERRGRMARLRQEVAALELDGWVTQHAELATSLRAVGSARPRHDTVR